MCAKQVKTSPKRRFAIGAEVRVKLPGVNGIVTQLDSSPTVLGEYWHTIRTQFGERREPGSNLELIPAPITNAKPKELLIPMTGKGLLPTDQAISLLRARLEEAIEDLHHDDPEVESWERVTQKIVERAFGEHSINAKHFVFTLSYARQSEDEKQKWHVQHIFEKKRLLRAFVKELEIIPPDHPQPQDERFEKLAVEEARKSVAEDERAHPLVGCVVVKDGKILATSHRGELRGNHAEYIALEVKLKDTSLAGCTVYTTLEPCTTRHDPKIPCADRLIERRVARVVVGMHDPNPNICGKGIRRLQGANIEVKLFPHLLIQELEELNRFFNRSHAETRGTEGLAEKEKASQSFITEYPIQVGGPAAFPLNGEDGTKRTIVRYITCGPDRLWAYTTTRENLPGTRFLVVRERPNSQPQSVETPDRDAANAKWNEWYQEWRKKGFGGASGDGLDGASPF